MKKYCKWAPCFIIEHDNNYSKPNIPIHIGIYQYYDKRFLQKLSTSNDTYGLTALLGYLKQKNNTSTYDPQPS